MRWCCFLFWCGYRFILALLAHFNWFTSIYVNCIYFVLWKSYDLLWFWMHLILCICFKPLRTKNYLIVWCNLIRKRFTLYPNSTYKVRLSISNWNFHTVVMIYFSWLVLKRFSFAFPKIFSHKLPEVRIKTLRKFPKVRIKRYIQSKIICAANKVISGNLYAWILQTTKIERKTKSWRQ